MFGIGSFSAVSVADAMSNTLRILRLSRITAIYWLTHRGTHHPYLTRTYSWHHSSDLFSSGSGWSDWCSQSLFSYSHLREQFSDNFLWAFHYMCVCKVLAQAALNCLSDCQL